MYYPINLYIKLSIFFVFNTIVHFLDICRHATQMLQIILATYIGKTSMLHILTEITITFKINSTIILKDKWNLSTVLPFHIILFLNSDTCFLSLKLRLSWIDLTLFSTNFWNILRIHIYFDRLRRWCVDALTFKICMNEIFVTHLVPTKWCSKNDMILSYFSLSFCCCSHCCHWCVLQFRINAYF